MQEQLKLALLQSHLYWENPVANRAHFAGMLSDISLDTDIVILPEMFTTGFTMTPAPLAETMGGPTVQWMKEWAKDNGCALCGSTIVQEAGKYFNRFVFVTPAGEVKYYDKRHTFNMAGEGEKYTAGSKQVVVEYLGWKLCLQICYDLRFPVFARNTQLYDALLYVANWPKARVAAWDALLKARAIENMSYSIGVNRVGLDGNNLEYVGHSGVYDILGETVAFSADKEEVLYATLAQSHIKKTRAQLPFLEDKDDFTLHL